METFLLILLMLAAVLASSVIDQLVPKVSSPLIQIGLGLVITVVAGHQIDLLFDQSELFLVLFIAPLLFHEAKEANKTELWRNRHSILSLAIGLVLAIIVGVGFFVHAIVPSISLAAALALGAALGPTDPIAVSAASKDADISPRCKALLKGESLINDASGIVAFQFAIAAAMTGAFSPAKAIGEFFIEFVGGIAFGLILGIIGNLIVRLVRSWGLENTTFHVLFEVFTPFIVFLAADQLGGSGILAVVAAGLVNVIAPRTAGPNVSRLNIVSTSVWRVISFTLNGIVFVLLGTQLPRAMETTWNNVTIPNWKLLLYVAAITAILIAVRFIWVLIMERIHHRHVAQRKEKAAKETNSIPEPRKTLAHDIRSAAIMTLGGPKGTVTLAVILTIPQAIAQRQLIMFLACGVIVMTLLLATFVVPILAPQKQRVNDEQRQRDIEANLEVLRVVIEELSGRQTPENRAATQIVIQQYNDRIGRVKELNGIEDEPNTKLRLKTLAWERTYVQQLVDDERVDRYVGYQYLARLARMEELILHQRSLRAKIRQHWIRWRTFGRRSLHEIIHKVPGAELSEGAQATRQLQIKCYEHVLSKLHEEMAGDSSANAEDISKLLIEYQRLLRTLRAAAPSITTFTKTKDKTTDIERMALEIELEQIGTRYDDGELSRAAAKRLRENVNLMQMDLEDKV